MEWSIKVICLIALLGTVALAQQEKNSWSWGSQPDESAGNHEFLVAEETQVYPEISNGTNSEVEDVIDTILSSTRQGKSIEGFDEVYKDPNVKQALNDGDDVQARNIIKDRLCSLGLMQVRFKLCHCSNCEFCSILSINYSSVMENLSIPRGMSLPRT